MTNHWIDTYDFLGTEKPEDLTVEQILRWCDEYFEEKGKYPDVKSGQIGETNETWCGINYALERKNRGLTNENSLAKLLQKERGIKNKKNLPKLTIEKILQWVDEFCEKHGKYPNRHSGEIEGVDESWSGIESALRMECRGLSGYYSLPKLLEKERGYRNLSNLQKLTEEQILQWIDEYYEDNQEYPKHTSGKIKGIDETWASIQASLQRGLRGLLGGSSIRQLLEKERGIRNPGNPQPLTEEQILQWCDIFSEKNNGKYPSENSGDIENTSENWEAISNALRQGHRNLPGNSSLHKFLKKYGRK